MNQKKPAEGFEQLAELWQQSQEAFTRAQKEMGEQFQQSLNQMAGILERESADPISAWKNMISAWVPAWANPGNGPAFPAELDFRKGQKAFFDMLDPQLWTDYAPEQLRIMLEQIAGGPQFADLVMPQQKMAEAWRESVDYQKAAADMSKVVQDAWVTAYHDFSQSHTIDELKEGKVNEATQAWLKAANHALLNAQGSPAFLDAQKRMIRASTEIRARQRDMAEEWSEAWQIPTRSEVDDLARTIHQLRRELREVKRELAALKGGQS